MKDIWDVIREWLAGHGNRRVTFTHGSRGGRWFCELVDEKDRVYSEPGVSQDEALFNALASMLEPEE